MVTYLIKELKAGDFFGLEEMVKIGFYKLEKKHRKVDKVKRLLRVTAT